MSDHLLISMSCTHDKIIQLYQRCAFLAHIYTNCMMLLHYISKNNRDAIISLSHHTRLNAAVFLLFIPAVKVPRPK